jgi:hypothetical protein
VIPASTITMSSIRRQSHTARALLLSLRVGPSSAVTRLACSVTTGSSGNTPTSARIDHNGEAFRIA